jgi:hypothetical protein
MKLVAIALLLFAFGQTAPGISGKWSGSFQVKGDDGHVPQLFVLTQDGMKLTGSGGPDASERYPIADGKIAGNHVTFELTNAFAKFTYDLTDSGSQMKGKLTIRTINSTRTADVVLTKSE